MVSPDTAMSRAQLVCIAIEAWLYGLYSVLAALTMWLLFTRRIRDKTTIMLMIHTFVMFAISTTHVVVILDYNFTIFLYHNASTEGDVVPSSDGRFLAFVLMLLLNCIIGDMVVIWRVWVIWARNKRAVAVPALSWLGSIVALIGSSYVLSLPGGLGFGDGLVVSPWVAIFMGLTLLTNFTAVIAISYRYWLYRKVVANVLGHQNFRNCRVSNALTLIVESGSLYCVTWTLVLIVYVTASRVLEVILLACVAQLTATYPTLIVVLVCLGISQRDDLDRLEQHSSIEFAPTRSTITCSRHPQPGVASTGSESTHLSGRLHKTIEIRVEDLPSYTRSDLELSLQDNKRDGLRQE
ncbi:hypothetical protein BDY19DRAFT_604548 [Irpex rosettiformis]|uniref:Uncharacterized protein n=1 Tax=Irpex rosettiformis TaxID=378272 RepID=A0ACB8TPF6_9APHY|nr:hypothetical protein BDY19DRAFT_604548 [Irpex rosettiformis]